jgi:hypothetical protein
VVKRRWLSVGAVVVGGCLAVGGAFYLHEKIGPADDSSDAVERPAATPGEVKNTSGPSPFDDAVVGPLLTQDLTPSEDGLHRATEPAYRRPPRPPHHEPATPRLPPPAVNGAVPTLPDPARPPSPRPGPLPEEPPLGGVDTESE